MGRMAQAWLGGWCGWLVVVAGLSIASDLAEAQGAATPEPLTLEGIARDTAEWVGSAPSQIRWSQDGESLYFMWNPEAADIPDLYVVSRDGGTPQKVPSDELRNVPPRGAMRNRDETETVYAAYGDLFLFTIADGTVRRLTDTDTTERNPHFVFDERSVAFERDQNLFIVEIDTGAVRQVTNFRTGPDPDADPDQTQLQAYLERQQTELFEYVRKTERLEEERDERRDAERGFRVEAHYLNAEQRVSDLRLSQDGRFVTFILADRQEFQDGQVVEMPRYVTSSGFVEMRRLGGGGGRVKAGEPVTTYALGVVDLTGDETRWMDHGQGDRAVSFSSPVWSDDGEHLIAWAGAVDHKDAWLQLLDLETGGTRTIVHEHDDAWVRGFRTGRLARGDGPAYGWMPDDERVYFLSERDGYFHLYVTGLDGGDPTQLTSGRFGLVDLRLSKDDERWYFISNEGHPAENQLYTMPLEGGARTRLTTESGWYTYQLSPDEIHAALTYSNATQPRELFVMPTRAGAALTQLFTATKAEFHRHDWRESEIVTFDDGEGHTIYADVWVPDRPLPGRPAIIRVHGAGWAQGVSRRWTNTLPFLHYLAQEGYIVLNLDYRGSRGYGRDFRTGIYRHMGETEVRSGLAAVEYLVTEQGVDRERIGLFGGSYGGFFTLMSMFKHPGVFKAGAVRAPVTDWAHYNHGYTTRILNAPYDDTEAYERSSPIYLAEGLEDHLLIQHGVQDDNVHFQDSVRLAQRLLELRKENWEIMIYPVEAHSLQNEDYNRYDVMRRRVDLFNRVLRAPAKPQRSGPDDR